MSMLQLLDTADAITPLEADRQRQTGRDALRRRTIIQTIGVKWRLWRERRVARHALASLNAHTLRDIGVTPEFVNYELWRSAWRPRLDGHAMRCLYGADASNGDPRCGPASVRNDICREPGL